MKNNPFIIILEELEINGVGKYVDISHILKEIFNVSNSSMDEEKVKLSSMIKDLLNIMIDENLLSLNGNEFSGLGNSSGGIMTWFDNVEIKATIRSQGLSYLSQDRNQKFIESVNQSVIDTNNATRSFIPYQKKVTTASIIISLVALAFSFITIFRTNNKEVRDLNKTLNIHLQKINQTLSNLRKSSSDSFKSGLKK